MRTDEAGGDDFRVIEYEKVSWAEEGGEVADGEIGEFSGGSAEYEEAGGVAGVGWGGSNPIVRDGERKEFLQEGVSHG